MDLKEIGLNIGSIIGNYFLESDDLHYGYWTDDLEVRPSEFAKAQQQYSQFIISHIPDAVENILDVGCGAGGLALKLVNAGYKVECVSPSSMLTARARELLAGRCHIHECRYEDFTSDRRYDLVMFSESFQYVAIEPALDLTGRLLKDGGHLLISDFFKTDAPGKSPLGGGHRLNDFYDVVRKHPFREVKNIDITKQTAPNIDMLGDICNRVGVPTKDCLVSYMQSNYPMLTKILAWKFRRRSEKLQRKYFSGALNGETFAVYKSYRLLLYEKSPAAGAIAGHS
jgi:SAM-dependent methyltransferase